MDYFDLGQQTTTTTGTGTITLGAPVAGYRALGSAQDGLTYRYLIRDGGTGGWEAGSTTYTHAGTSMTRTVMYSSNANAAINLSGTNVVVSLGSISAVDLAQIVSDIATNAADITTNAGDIATNTAAIADHETRISDLETFEGAATTDIANNAAAILVNAGDIDDLETFQATIEGIFAGAIADGTYTTAAGDQIVTVNGLVTSFTVGPYSLPDDDGTSGQVLTTDGAGNWTWQDASGGTTLTLVEESGSAFRPVTDSATTSGDASHAWLNGYYDAITLGGVDLDTRIGTAEADIATNAAAILVNAGDIDDLETFQTTTEGIFAGAISDGTHTTGAGDQIATASGVVTNFTVSPYQGIVGGSTTDNRNYKLGYQALDSILSTATYNIGIGARAGQLITSGDYNICIGLNSGSAIGTGSDNITIGQRAGDNITSGSRNVAIGYFVDPPTPTGSDQLAIGFGTSTNQKWMTGNSSGHVTFPNNVTVTGSLTVASVSIVPELVSLNSWLFDNTQDIAELQASVSAGKAGLRISRTSTTQISIAAGRIHNHDISKSIVVDSPITLDLTDSGDFVNSSVRATATWFHVLLGHLTSDGSVVAALSTTLAKPAAWDDWQMIGAVQTNTTGSGEFRKFVQDDRYFGLDEEANLYDNTSPPTTATPLRLWCPPMACMAHFAIAIRNPSGGSYLLLRSSSGGDNNKSVNLSSGTYVDNIELKRPTDSSGQIWFLLFAAVTFGQFYFFGIGFDYPIGEAGAV